MSEYCDCPCHNTGVEECDHCTPTRNFVAGLSVGHKNAKNGNFRIDLTHAKDIFIVDRDYLLENTTAVLSMARVMGEYPDEKEKG